MHQHQRSKPIPLNTEQAAMKELLDKFVQRYYDYKHSPYAAQDFWSPRKDQVNGDLLQIIYH